MGHGFHGYVSYVSAGEVAQPSVSGFRSFE